MRWRIYALSVTLILIHDDVAATLHHIYEVLLTFIRIFTYFHPGKPCGMLKMKLQ